MGRACLDKASQWETTVSHRVSREGSRITKVVRLLIPWDAGERTDHVQTEQCQGREGPHLHVRPTGDSPPFLRGRWDPLGAGE